MMDRKQYTRNIIESYKPAQGFFNLSEKPVELDKKTYAKILNMQNILVCEAKNIEYYKQPFNNLRLQELQELSAKLQHIILRYWKLEEL